VARFWRTRLSASRTKYRTLVTIETRLARLASWKRKLTLRFKTFSRSHVGMGLRCAMAEGLRLGILKTITAVVLRPDTV